MRKTGSNITHISNTNNNNSNELRGGEKKVMKKSLSVILSTTMALSAFSSVALAATSSSEFEDLKNLSAADKVIFDQLIKDGIFLGTGDGKFGVDAPMKRSQFAVAISKALKYTADAKVSSFSDVTADAPELPYIEAAYKNGVANGNPTTPPTFSPADEVSKEQLAIFLVGAMGAKYKDEASKATGNDATVTSWAQGYVATALKYKLLENNADGTFGGKEKATRYTLAKGVDATLKAIKEANKPAEATKVDSVKADNLAQVVVTFDGPVDKASAEEVGNYVINNDRVIASAKLSEDATSVTLELDTKAGNQFTQQKEYKLSVSNIKSGDKVVSAQDVAFTPIDVTIPTVSSITALGNKTVKVKFNEPVKPANTASFTIDGKAVAANTSVVSDTVILKLSSKLADGDHTITVKGVTDFNNLKSLSEEQTFTVVADTDAPTIDSVVNATFEKVTVKFSEPVDPSTVLISNVYWMQGSSKKVASGVKAISDDTYEFDFSANKIQYTTDLFVSGVRDYSGNLIANDTKVQVNPVIDQTRPEVTSAEYKDNKFTIKFNKIVNRDSALKASNYVLKNSKGEVIQKYKEVALLDNRTVVVTLPSTLGAGTYTLEVAGVTDNTTLKNTMLPYSKTLTLKDQGQPTITEVVRNDSTNQVFVQFNKAMATSGEGSVLDHDRYLITLSGKEVTLPEGTTIATSSDSKVVIIQLPGDVDVKNVSKVKVSVVKAANGKYPEQISSVHSVVTKAASKLEGAKATDNTTIELKFDRALAGDSLSTYDFNVVANNTYLSVVNAEFGDDNDVVILTLSDANKLNNAGKYDNKDVNVSLRQNASTSTIDGKSAVGSATINGKIGAAVTKINGNIDGKTIEVVFDNDLTAVTDPAARLNVATDFIVKKGSTKLQPGTDYNVKSVTNVANAGVVTIELTSTQTPGVYNVALNPRFLKAGNGELVGAIDTTDAIYVNVVASNDYVVNTATEAVLKAETTKDQNDVAAAQVLVNALPEGTVKAGLQTKLDAVTAPVISNVSIKSNNATSPAIAKNGDILTLTFTSSKPVTKQASFKINGSNPDTFVETVVNGVYTYTATHLVDAGDVVGNAVTFQINVQTATGIFSPTVEATTDKSAVVIVA